MSFHLGSSRVFKLIHCSDRYRDIPVVGSGFRATVVEPEKDGFQTAKASKVGPCYHLRPGERLLVTLCRYRTSTDDDVFYLFLQKQKIGAELHVYLEEGTYHKRLFRGPSTNDMKK
jgi:hypothetical protein